MYQISSLTIQVVKRGPEGGVEDVTLPQEVPTTDNASTVEAVLEVCTGHGIERNLPNAFPLNCERAFYKGLSLLIACSIF